MKYWLFYAAENIQIFDLGKMVKTVTSKGSEIWKDDDGCLHREDGPAIIRSNGREEWHFHGKRHRVGGPAVVSLTAQRNGGSREQSWFLVFAAVGKFARSVVNVLVFSLFLVFARY